MNITELRDSIIPKLKAFCGVPIIEADQVAKKPETTHATYKFTSPYLKDVGWADIVPEGEGDTYTLNHKETYKVVASFTAYDADIDLSIQLAQKMHDWFAFQGRFDLDDAGIVVVSLGDVENRDALVVDGYERRNGFDVTFRVGRVLSKPFDWIDRAEITKG